MSITSAKAKAHLVSYVALSIAKLQCRRMGWTGRAPAPNGSQGRGQRHEEHIAISQKTNAVVASTIGIGTGKNTLLLVGLDNQGTIVLREKLGRSRIRTRLANVPRCLIGIEAGMATHYVARELIALGHDVRQVPPAYARPFRQAHKNDFRGRLRDCRSCAATIDTLRSGKDRRSVGLTSTAPGTTSLDQRAHCRDQSDP